MSRHTLPSRPRVIGSRRLPAATRVRLEKLRANAEISGQVYKILELLLVLGADREAGAFPTAATVGRRLGMTANAVRCHFSRMRRKGLIVEDEQQYRDGIPTRRVNLMVVCGEPVVERAGACHDDTHTGSLLSERTTPNPSCEDARGTSKPETSHPPREIREPVPTPASSIPDRVRAGDWRKVLHDTPELAALSRFNRYVSPRWLRRLGRAIKRQNIQAGRLRQLLRSQANPATGGLKATFDYLVGRHLTEHELQQMQVEATLLEQQIQSIRASVPEGEDLGAAYWQQQEQMVSFRTGHAGSGDSPMEVAPGSRPWLVWAALAREGRGGLVWSQADLCRLADSLIRSEFGCEYVKLVGFDPVRVLGLSWEKLAVLRGCLIGGLERELRRVCEEQQKAA